MGKTSKTSPGASEAMHKQEMDDYDTKDNLNTIVKAHAIMQDPMKMKKVKKHLGVQKQAFKSIDQVKQYANQKYGGPGGGPQPGAAADPDMGDDEAGD